MVNTKIDIPSYYEVRGNGYIDSNPVPPVISNVRDKVQIDDSYKATLRNRILYRVYLSLMFLNGFVGVSLIIYVLRDKFSIRDMIRVLGHALIAGFSANLQSRLIICAPFYILLPSLFPIDDAIQEGLASRSLTYSMLGFAGALVLLMTFQRTYKIVYAVAGVRMAYHIAMPMHNMIVSLLHETFGSQNNAVFQVPLFYGVSAFVIPLLAATMIMMTSFIWPTRSLALYSSYYAVTHLADIVDTCYAKPIHQWRLDLLLVVFGFAAIVYSYRTQMLAVKLGDSRKEMEKLQRK